MKTIILFGYLPRDLTRNWILEKGLTEHGYRVLECRTLKKGFLKKYMDLTRKFLSMRKECDIILVTFMGYYFMPLAWILAKLTGKILIFDGLTSIYESEVEDRRRLSRFDPRAWFLFFLDWFSYAVADLVLLESPVYGKFLSHRYGTPENRFLFLPVACHTDIFHPATVARVASPAHPGQGEIRKFRVMYQGRFIPIHGVETILDAAAEIQKRGIKDIEFHFIGKGQTGPTMRKRAEELGLRNVLFRGFLPALEEVAEELRNADVGLGMFQKSSKADLCMPHKVYEVLASRVALITIESTSAKAIFGSEEVALFIPPEDGKALAEAIIRLKEDAKLRERIADKGYIYFQEHFDSRSIVKPLAHWFRGAGMPKRAACAREI
ncbi:MAG TPA: glycosyltransferase [Candidatus Peribacterales bacterium]|nr:glycosyltransferase [Candidatus Peribacterales bacterium]